jgi:hypothetical protein
MHSPEPSKDELRALWEAGVSLDAAWVEFAAFFDRFALRALRTHPENDVDVLGLGSPRYLELNKGWLPRTWEARQKKLASTTVSERINLLGEIFSGDLWAIGFRTKESGFDEVVRIPRQLFFFDELGGLDSPSEINWGKGELTTDTASFFDIHVVRAPTDPSQLAATSTEQTSVHMDSADTASKRQEFDLEGFIDRQVKDLQGHSYISVPTDSARGKGIDNEIGTQQKRTPGRPSMRDDIIEAIADYAQTDPKLEKVPNKRHLAYCSYLMAHGYDRGKTDKIGKSTFEKYETEYRKAIR